METNHILKLDDEQYQLVKDALGMLKTHQDEMINRSTDAGVTVSLISERDVVCGLLADMGVDPSTI
jgi:hypothetical protein